MDKTTSTATFTFCECSENHVNNQKNGTIAENGFTCDEIESIKDKFEKAGAVCELIDLNEMLDEDIRELSSPASILVIRKGLSFIIGDEPVDDLAETMFNLEWDKKVKSYGRVVNKKARHNLCFSKSSQVADYEAGKGTIVAYSDIPILEKLHKKLPKWFGEKARDMECEGNLYYDWKSCYIGFHGDFERRRVIGVRLGHKFSLWYRWYLNSKKCSEVKRIVLKHGDIYVMSEKAVGTDWKKKKIYTLRHAAGTKKVIMKKED